jgi:hypothetical protein
VAATRNGNAGGMSPNSRLIICEPRQSGLRKVNAALAKEREAVAARGLEKMAKLRMKEEEKLRMLREVAELFRDNWPCQEKNR